MGYLLKEQLFLFKFALAMVFCIYIGRTPYATEHHGQKFRSVAHCCLGQICLRYYVLLEMYPRLWSPSHLKCNCTPAPSHVIPHENSCFSEQSYPTSIDKFKQQDLQGRASTCQGLDMFRSAFGMSRRTFDYICSLVKEHMMSKTHFTFTNGKPMLLHDQVALALRRLGSGNSLITIGDSFGAHHSTVSQVTWRFVEAIEEKRLLHLNWPSTEEEMSRIKCKFEKIRGLPNCCGAIDTTHITMLLTSSEQEADCWLDRREKHSMILQAVVDPDMRFRDIVAGWPGKMNDSEVLQNSSFFKKCEEGENLNSNKIFLSEETDLREYIIGDSAFPLLPWLITPYQGKELSETKVDFNKRLLATHFVAHKALAQLKEVWNMIKGDMWRPDKHKLPRFILVCCILHNIIIDMEKDEDFEQVPSYLLHDPGYRQEFCETVDKNGCIVRDKLAKYFSGK